MGRPPYTSTTSLSSAFNDCYERSWGLGRSPLSYRLELDLLSKRDLFRRQARPRFDTGHSPVETAVRQLHGSGLDTWTITHVTDITDPIKGCAAPFSVLLD